MANEPHVRPFDSDTITEDYFREFLIQPRTIGSVRPDISLQLFGRRFETPVMTAALSHLTGLKEDGLVEMARGAATAGALTLVGMTQAEQYAAIAATGAPLASTTAMRAISSTRSRRSATNSTVGASTSA